jgi:small GTP-binding protein
VLRQVIVLLGKTPIFKREYGKGLSWETLSPILSSLMDFLQQSREDVIEFMNIVNMKICYSSLKRYSILFIFITDQTDKEETIKEQTVKIRDTFISKFSEQIQKGIYDTETYDPLRYDTDEAFRELRPKIALIGFSGVGKTTITRLIRAEEIPMKHIPTITGDVAAIKIGSLHMYLWDFAGQEQFSFIWSKFVKGSDAIILVVDSTEHNMSESKFFVDLIKKEAPKSRVAIVANKQDLPGAQSPERIAELLGYRTYPLVAIDPNQRGAMLNIIGEVVEVTHGVTSLIQPMLERESLVESAEAAIMQGNLLKASEIYKNIAELSQNLGEDDMSGIFMEQSRLLARQVQAAAQQVADKKVAKPLATQPAPRVELPPEVDEILGPAAPAMTSPIASTPIPKAPSKSDLEKLTQAPQTPSFSQRPAPSPMQAPNVKKSPVAAASSADADKTEIATLEKELADINTVIKELKMEVKNMGQDEFEKEMVQLEDRKNTIHKKIMELRMNIIKKLAI